MSFLPRLPLIMLFFCGGAAQAQAGVETAEAAIGDKPAAGVAAAAASPQHWRSLAGYPFAAQAATVAAMQNLAHALQLRELCADRRVSDEVVAERLQRFSAITARAEDCQTILDY